MKFSTQTTDNPEINLAPIVDVVFLMLIFFVVATSFTHQAALNLQLPESTHAESTDESMLSLTVTADGGIYARGEPVNDLERWLAEAVASIAGDDGSHSPRLLIQAEAAARHADVVRVLDSARAAGIDQAAIATEAGQP